MSPARRAMSRRSAPPAGLVVWSSPRVRQRGGVYGFGDRYFRWLYWLGRARKGSSSTSATLERPGHRRGPPGRLRFCVGDGSTTADLGYFASAERPSRARSRPAAAVRRRRSTGKRGRSELCGDGTGPSRTGGIYGVRSGPGPPGRRGGYDGRSARCVALRTAPVRWSACLKRNSAAGSCAMSALTGKSIGTAWREALALILLDTLGGGGRLTIQRWLCLRALRQSGDPLPSSHRAATRGAGA